MLDQQSISLCGLHYPVEFCLKLRRLDVEQCDTIYIYIQVWRPTTPTVQYLPNLQKNKPSLAFQTNQITN